MNLHSKIVNIHGTLPLLCKSKGGFSLVELSIVLVILGLLVGGVLAGKSLIRASELRSVSADLIKYQTAFLVFRDKYLAIPGDMNNATSFWGDDAAACADAAVADGTPGTCNGNGNRVITQGVTPSATAENFQAWKQLALAGLIEGTYSGLAGAGGGGQAVIGTNVPSGKISNIGYSVYNYNNAAGGDAYNFAANYGNMLEAGASNTIYSTSGPGMRSEEVWNIDVKMDDGLSLCKEKSSLFIGIAAVLVPLLMIQRACMTFPLTP